MVYSWIMLSRLAAKVLKRNKLLAMYLKTVVESAQYRAFRKASGEACFTTSPNLTPKTTTESSSLGIVTGSMGAVPDLLNSKAVYTGLFASRHQTHVTAPNPFFDGVQDTCNSVDHRPLLPIVVLPVSKSLKPFS